MDEVIDWLLRGDPAIRWQVQRDLLDRPRAVYEKERAGLATQGWGARLLTRQDIDGSWGGGVYTPKWISTTYTLLLLRQLGLAQHDPQARRGCEKFFLRGLERDGGINLFKSTGYSETCINGMLLALLCYFHFPDERVHSVARFLLKEQMPDGGWNCQRGRGATHASFHTTISVLEGLTEYSARAENKSAIQRAARRGQEFLLRHQLYRSHRTGRIVDPAMTRMTFPPRWHYDFLRALDHLQAVKARRDERMTPAIELLRSKRTPRGKWLADPPWPGRVFFELEKTGRPSRWNTLRALRVLKWWEH